MGLPVEEGSPFVRPNSLPFVDQHFAQKGEMCNLFTPCADGLICVRGIHICQRPIVPTLPFTGKPSYDPSEDTFDTLVNFVSRDEWLTPADEDYPEHWIRPRVPQIDEPDMLMPPRYEFSTNDQLAS